MPATTPLMNAQRHVEEFLVTKQLDQSFAEVFTQAQTQPEAAAYLENLATRLGDKACTPAPLGDDARAKLTTWVEHQDTKGVERVELEAACGRYAWAHGSARAMVLASRAW